jgi:hypothetical protein
MRNEFAPYEEALAVKELGFDYCCFCSYTSEGKLADSYGTYYKIYPSEITIAPLYQQAFRWFREKYNLKHIISPVGETYMSTIDMHSWTAKHDTYEEAELACLKKLIEIVNQNKDEL